ncbi:tetratricopeptide repeat protein [Nitratifractor sp.]
MEEITLRFEIVRLAVELGDYETIDIQCRKLRDLSLDDRLNEIIDMLESKNFRQALYEMKHYHRSLEDEFFSQATARKNVKKKKDEVNLFDGWEEKEPEEDEERTLDLDDILKLAREEMENRQQRQKEMEEPVSPIEEEPATEPRSSAAEDEEESEEEEWAIETERPLQPEESAVTREPSVDEEESERGESVESEAEAVEEERKSEPVRAESSPMSEYEREESVSPASSAVKSYGKRNEENKKYPPISYIDQKYRNMVHQFPPLERSKVLPPEVEKMRKQIATEGYTEEEIEAFLQHYQEYKREGHRAEAAQVLLLAAATESKFAQFLLARELFRGEVLQQDHAESFTQINALADQNFAEAICDLGQLYEYGIGIGKDREMALLLYEEAAELGVARARKHYERLKNSRGLKGLFNKVKVPSIPLPKKKS